MGDFIEQHLRRTIGTNLTQKLSASSCELRKVIDFVRRTFIHPLREESIADRDSANSLCHKISLQLKPSANSTLQAINYIPNRKSSTRIAFGWTQLIPFTRMPKEPFFNTNISEIFNVRRDSTNRTLINIKGYQRGPELFARRNIEEALAHKRIPNRTSG